MPTRFSRPFVLTLIAVCCATAPAQQAPRQTQSRLVITPDRADCVYDVGQAVQWQIRWDGPSASPGSVEYVVKKGDLAEVAKGTVALTDGVGRVRSEFAEPGTLLLKVKATVPDAGEGATTGATVPASTRATAPAKTEFKAASGAVAAPGKIEPSAGCPDDFDAFWAEKLKELAAVPPEAALERVDVGDAAVQYSHITMNNIRGTHVRGQLARPAGGEKFPALLIVQWAGVYPLEKAWAVDRAKDGWLVLNILAHDLPIDRPAAFYKDQLDGPLKDYWAIGNDDRETSYFLRMYLSCYRAAEYLATRGDWDGKTLVVMGGSQGGMQSLVTAAIHPKITAALASVPAGCDMLGPEVGRKGGWPQWYAQTENKDARKVHEASRYFDVVNFAPRIRCPVLIGAGLIDETCPAAGILAAANRVPGEKEIVLLPNAGHQNENNSHDPYEKRCWNAWLPALRQGLPAPVRP